jgi:hypothetical protein
MDRTTYLARFKEALALDDRGAAATLLVQLAEDCARSEQGAVGFADEQEALGMAATFRAEAGQTEAAAELFEATANAHLEEALGHRSSAADCLAHAAHLRFSAGDPVAGAELAEQALRLYGDLPQPAAILETVLGEWRAALTASRERPRGGA